MDDTPEEIPVRRLDRYVILVGTTRMLADVDQERRIRELDNEGRARFVRIMGRA